MAYTNTPAGWKIKKVTASGIALGPGDIFGGVMMPTAGTSTTLTAYNDQSAVAANLIIATTAALTAGQFVDSTGGVIPVTSARSPAEGLFLSGGLYLTVGGTGSPVFWVLYK